MLVFLSISLISVGIILLKKPFFSFASATAILLNSMLESNQDERNKQKMLIKSMGKTLSTFGFLLLSITIILGISIVPIMLYLKFTPATFIDLDTSSFYFYLSMILGSGVLFLFPGKNKSKNEDYSAWSRLLHSMILDNYNISRTLFKLEKRFFKKTANRENKDFVIVTGLARGGTTALTNLLFESGRFHSLSYDNMPFLLSVNIWRKFYHPRKNKLKQRAHGDNLMFGYKTIEALEEHFFKVFLNDKYIDNKILKKHDIDRDTYEAYLTYQNLVSGRNEGTTYLAKNNNFILRYRSLRKYNPDFKNVIIFRSPLSHAYSLLNQHKRFSGLHKEDPFALEYMNWLGHHEFGLNQKVFDLKGMEQRKKYDNTSINYWIAVWISYYTHILSIVSDKNLFLVEYADLCSRPNQLLITLGKRMNIELTVDQRDPYTERELPDLDINSELLDQATVLYNKLKEYKVAIDNPEPLISPKISASVKD